MTSSNDTPTDKVHQAVMEYQSDPLPYGIAPSAGVLETLMDQAVAQGILGQRFPLADLFARDTVDLAG